MTNALPEQLNKESSCDLLFEATGHHGRDHMQKLSVWQLVTVPHSEDHLLSGMSVRQLVIVPHDGDHESAGVSVRQLLTLHLHPGNSWLLKLN